MKTDQPLVSCYEDFLDLCSIYRLPVGNLNIEKLMLFENKGIFDKLPFGSCLIDYSSRHFLYLSHNSEEILSYSKEDYMQGIEFHYNNMLPEDRQVFNYRIFPDILRFLLTIPQSEFEYYRFSFNYRFYRKDGCFMNILQHSTYFEPDKFGRPLLNQAIFSDITFFKMDDWMSLTISHYEKGRGYIPVLKKRYKPKSKTCISSREMEVLNLSLKGLSSKLIADKLFLSVYTVKNHKRNMMEKTASRNMSELINYALKNKLLI